MTRELYNQDKERELADLDAQLAAVQLQLEQFDQLPLNLCTIENCKKNDENMDEAERLITEIARLEKETYEDARSCAKEEEDEGRE